MAKPKSISAPTDFYCGFCERELKPKEIALVTPEEWITSERFWREEFRLASQRNDLPKTRIELWETIVHYGTRDELWVLCGECACQFDYDAQRNKALEKWLKRGKPIGGLAVFDKELLCDDCVTHLSNIHYKDSAELAFFVALLTIGEFDPIVARQILEDACTEDDQGLFSSLAFKVSQLAFLVKRNE